MGYRDYSVCGEVPDFGAIFMSNIETKNECFRRKLFGLPLAKSNFVLQVKKGMILFLFEFERRQLSGVFRATSDGEINMEPNAFRSSGKNFPAQVRFTQLWNCNSLAEHEFKDAIRDNYFSGKKFHFGLSKDQVRKLMMLFAAKRLPKKHPERSFRREADMPAAAAAGEHRRFVDNRNNLVKDRIGFVSEDDVHFNGNYVEEVNNFSYDRRPKYNDDRSLTNYATNDDFGDSGTRQVKLGKHPDHSLGGLGSVADAGLRLMDDVTDEREMHTDIGEIRVIQDGYRQILTEPDGKRFGEVGLASSDARFLRDKRNERVTDDEYPVLNSLKRGPCRMVVDGRFFGHEMVESEQRTLTTRHPLHNLKVLTDYDEEFSIRPRKLTQHPPMNMNMMNEPRGIKPPDYDEEFNIRSRNLTQHSMNMNMNMNEPRGIKPPDYDEDFRFGPVSPTCHNSIGGVVSTNDIAFSLSKQNTLNPISESEDSYGRTYDSGYPPYSTSDAAPIPYDPEISHIQLRPSSCFTGGPSSSLVDYHHRSSPMSESLGSMRYLNDDSFSSKTPNTARDTDPINGSWVFRSAAGQGDLFPERGVVDSTENMMSKGHRSSSAYDNRYPTAEPRSKHICETSHNAEEDPIHHDDKKLYHLDRRESVFSRLTSAPKALKIDMDNEEKHKLDASVNKVMKMLEKVVSSSPIGKSISVFQQKDDDDKKKHNTITTASKVKIEPEWEHERDDDNLVVAFEVIESGSILEETRLVDFKRRKKAKRSLVGGGEIEGKRKKLVRPVFLADGNSTKPVESCCEKTLVEREEDPRPNGNGRRKTCGWLDE